MTVGFVFRVSFVGAGGGVVGQVCCPTWAPGNMLLSAPFMQDEELLVVGSLCHNELRKIIRLGSQHASETKSTSSWFEPC